PESSVFSAMTTSGLSVSSASQSCHSPSEPLRTGAFRLWSGAARGGSCSPPPVPAHPARAMCRFHIFVVAPAAGQLLFLLWREHPGICGFLGGSGTLPSGENKLVTSHLRLVVKIAIGYRGYGLPISELISEGSLGMMQAVKRFD